MTGGRWTRLPEGRVAGFHFDSRQIQPGGCFLAIPTEARDGHDFVQAAKDAGAIAAIVEREMSVDLPQLVVANTVAALGAIGHRWRGAYLGPLIAITGSCGKTSTKELLVALLAPQRIHATPGNWNNHLGVSLTLLEMDPITTQVAVCEAGMNAPGEIAELARILAPTAGLVTMVGPAHLERVGSLEAIAEEKASLLAGVPEGGAKVFPANCLTYAAFRALSGHRHLLVFHDQDHALTTAHARPEDTIWEATIQADNLLILTTHTERLSFQLPNMSTGMQQNAALALVMAHLQGASNVRMQDVILGWQADARRGTWKQHGAQTWFVDCYNASPAAMHDSLQFFAEARPKGPALFVLGTMAELGTDGPAYHRTATEKLSAQPGDQFILLGEEALVTAYAEGLQANGIASHAVSIYADREAARETVQSFAGTVFLKGSRYLALENLVPHEATAWQPNSREVVSC